MKKIVIPLLVILAVAFGVFYFSKNAVAPGTEADVLGSFSNWKTYDGKSTIGLTMKYPADWTVDDSFPDYVSFLPVDGNGFSAYRIRAGSKKQTLTQWLKANDKANSEVMGGQYNDYVISTKKSKVAKLSAIKRVEHADAAGFDFIQTYVKSGNYFYNFALVIRQSDSYDEEDEKVYNKILSTVQFAK